MKVYNAEGMILGRLACKAAKDALLGEEVRVVNCEKVVISGNNVFKENKQKRQKKGYPLKSAKLHRVPDRHVRRTIRGMLPWRTTRGREAFKRVMCYNALPTELADKELIAPEDSKASKLPILKSKTVGELCSHLRGTK